MCTHGIAANGREDGLCPVHPKDPPFPRRCFPGIPSIAFACVCGVTVPEEATRVLPLPSPYFACVLCVLPGHSFV